jgi:hypothetical protein
MPELTPGKKSWETRRKRIAELETQQKHISAWDKAHAAEAASKSALKSYCAKHGWQVAFFEGKTGAPRTGIIDAVAFRIARGKSDVLDLRLVQLKGGNAGVSGREIARLKHAVETVSVNWLIAAFDGDALHLVPELES